MKKKIMIVDDDPSILIAIRELFEKEGFIVYTVNSGMECIEELKNGFKGVVLMDIMMPYLDGWETIRKIRNQNLQNNITISILTAKDDPGQNMDEFKDIINDYITKPFSPKELISIVENYYA